jgi:hypothetical protein
VRVIPLPRHLADLQVAALRTRLGIVRPDDPVPRHFLTAFVCIHCRRVCTHLIEDAPASAAAAAAGAIDSTSTTPTTSKRGGGGGPVFETASGNTLVAIVHTTADIIAADERARRNPPGRYPHYDELPHGTRLVDYYLEHGARFTDSDITFWPPMPTLASTPDDTAVTAVDAYLATRHTGRFDPAAAFAVGSDGSARRRAASRRVSRDDETNRAVLLPMTMVPGESAEETYLRRWNERSGGHLRVGHRSADPADRSFLWVCVSRRKKIEEKKLDALLTAAPTKATARARAAVTPREVDDASRAGQAQLFRAARANYGFSRCSWKQLIEVNLFTYALRLDNHVYMACCNCLGFMRLADAIHVNESLVCGRCAMRIRAIERASYAIDDDDDNGPSDTTTTRVNNSLAPPTTTTIHCRLCGRYASMAEIGQFVPFLVYDDVSVGDESFIEVHFCAKHAHYYDWIARNANIPSLSNIDVALSVAATAKEKSECKKAEQRRRAAAAAAAALSVGTDDTLRRYIDASIGGGTDDASSSMIALSDGDDEHTTTTTTTDTVGVDATVAVVGDDDNDDDADDEDACVVTSLVGLKRRQRVADNDDSMDIGGGDDE